MLKKDIKLNMNEMPYLPPKEILEAARKGLTDMNRYTNLEELARLRQLLADYSRVPQKHIILGSGSDPLLREIIHTLSKGRKIINELAIQVYRSTTNFLLAKTDIPDLVRKFHNIGIHISDLSNQLSPGFIRVSIGNREENDAFIKGYMKIRERF